MLYENLKKDPEILAYYKKGNDILGILGYTDHSIAHGLIVARKAASILHWFHADEQTIDLAKTAGLLHDIGNAINREHHAEYGALLANDILRNREISLEDRVTVVSAVANHDESTGAAEDFVSAALIIADKTDVRRDRVREKDSAKFDIHDRVNYAVTGSTLCYDGEKNRIKLNLQIDENICSMYEYFEIFLGRMVMCRRAAEILGSQFRLTVNGNKVL